MKITNTTIGRLGRLGNQLFQVSALLGLSERHNAKPCIPTTWSYKSNFNIPEGVYEDVAAKITVSDGYYHFNPNVVPNECNSSVCLKGYFQSEKYFVEIKDRIREWLMPIGYPVKLKDNSVGVHIRRGDYVGNPGYTQLNADYYLAVINKYFNDPKYTFYITTDDIVYAKEHFHGDKFIVEERSSVDDLGILASCTHHILAPSSFSWWGTYLAEPGGINIRPKRTHVGHLSHLIEDDMWQPEWTIEDVTPLQPTHPCYGKPVERIDLTDVTFVIPVKYDHPDRKENLFVVIPYLQKWFKTNIILGEQGPKSEFMYMASLGVKYVRFPDGPFHRTRFINEMTMMATTPYVFNWDADVIVPVGQIVECVQFLRNGCEFAYPYDGDFLHVHRSYLPKIMATLNTNVFDGNSFKGVGDRSVGGAVGFNKEAFIRVGMENENFVSHGAEDVDRLIRFNMLSKTERIKGPLYHFDHWCGPDSKHSGHDYCVINRTEIRIIKSIKTKEEMIKHINTWPWRAQYIEQLKLIKSA